MIPTPFDYTEAASVDEAIELLTEHGDESKLVAGGHSLLPLMKFRLATPSVLIDIGRIEALKGVRDGGDHLIIGALSTHQSVELNEMVRSQSPLLAAVAGQVGDPQVRHRGTIGGSLAHADPASDLPAALIALGGSVVAQGPSGQREIHARDLFTGFLESAVAADEVVTEIRIPKAPDAAWSFQKFNRRAQDWAIVGAAVVANGTTSIGLINMGPTPMAAVAVEQALESGAEMGEAAALAAENTSPPSDLNGDAEYRGHLARVLVSRALTEVSGSG